MDPRRRPSASSSRPVTPGSGANDNAAASGVLPLDAGVNDASGGTDGDGASDIDECRSGPNPLDAASLLNIVAVDRTTGDNLTLRWQAVSQKHYRVDHTATLLPPDGTRVEPDIQALETGTMGWRNGKTAESRFHQVVLMGE